jgi:nitrogen regulatory protein PII-like uncharacterized protein
MVNNSTNINEVIVHVVIIGGIVDHHCLETIVDVVDHHCLDAIVHVVDIGGIVDHHCLEAIVHVVDHHNNMNNHL